VEVIERQRLKGKVKRRGTVVLVGGREWEGDVEERGGGGAGEEGGEQREEK